MGRDRMEPHQTPPEGPLTEIRLRVAESSMPHLLEGVPVEKVWLTDNRRCGVSDELCPRCGHPLDCHNDAGTIRGGQGAMCCYYNDSRERTGTYRQFESSGQPVACGCSYDGPGTDRYY